MAATIAKAIGSDRTRSKSTQKLGSVSAEGQANTWHTFATAFVRADGSGYLEVKRGGTRERLEFLPEGNGSNPLVIDSNK